MKRTLNNGSDVDMSASQKEKIIESKMELVERQAYYFWIKNRSHPNLEPLDDLKSMGYLKLCEMASRDQIDLSRPDIDNYITLALRNLFRDNAYRGVIKGPRRSVKNRDDFKIEIASLDIEGAEVDHPDTGSPCHPRVSLSEDELLDLFNNRELAEKIVTTLKNMGVGCIALFYLGELSSEELAEKLNKSSSSIRPKVHRIKQAVESRLKREKET